MRKDTEKAKRGVSSVSSLFVGKSRSTRGTGGAAQGSGGPFLLALTTWSGPGKGGVVFGLWILSALRFLFLAGGPRDLWVY